jgi:hypothetical protein
MLYLNKYLEACLMSEITKKKPDFNKLDFSKITGEISSDKTPEIPKPIEGVGTIKEKKIVQEGTWINGKHNNDITPEEFKFWLAELIPGTGVEKWRDDDVATPKDRDKIITRLSNTLNKVFCFPRTLPVDDKKYVN